MPGDVELAFKLVPGLRHVNLSISTSDQMIQGKFLGRKTREDILQTMVEAVAAARSHEIDSIAVNAEDASRTDLDFLIRFGLAAREQGAVRMRYCDTLGYDNPFTIYDTIKTLARETGMGIEVHCHGDLGMAVANSIAGARGAMDGGQDAYINTTVNGIGHVDDEGELVSSRRCGIVVIPYGRGDMGRYVPLLAGIGCELRMVEAEDVLLGAQESPGSLVHEGLEGVLALEDVRVENDLAGIVDQAR